MEPNAIKELQHLAESINAKEIHMMISVGGATAVYEYLQRYIAGRVEYLKHQQEAAA
ncbi:hypothetical protein ACO1PK_00890 [Alishewanella sp. d11]|uniref:hypothetical protein n=1 Tax=Alishewanella sp. d11 TaxID=3414030 RepID=UPI003BF88F38